MPEPSFAARVSRAWHGFFEAAPAGPAVDYSAAAEALTTEAIRTRTEEFCNSRPDLRATRYIFGGAGIYQWAHSVGVCLDEQLRAASPPVPPHELRRLTADPDAEVFLWTGFVDLAQFIALYEHHRPAPPEGRAAVLDFGCGCGRMMRFLAPFKDRYETHGADVNPALVEWCQENMNGITTACTKPVPPLPYADGKFDLVYSVSVFTHLAEKPGEAYMEEMHRIIKPGGTLIITTHGEPVVQTVVNSPQHQEMLRVPAERIKEIQANFETQPFVFVPYPETTVQRAKAGASYGNTFVHPRYVRERWGKHHFRLVAHYPAAQRGWQDVVVLHRR